MGMRGLFDRSNSGTREVVDHNKFTLAI